MKHKLFPLSELAPGEIRRALVGSTAIAVMRTTRGEVFALRDRCPHKGPQLSIGTICNVATGDHVGDVRLLADRFAVRCPWHQFEFDVETGRCLGDPSLRTRVYPVEIVDGHVVVER